ncbi:MAG: MauE/DoxX family redox-associated membrane protein [Phycisphaerales bacterium JB054]
MSASARERILSVAMQGAVLFVAMTWLTSGIYKFMDMPTFTSAVSEHGIWPESLAPALILVPIFECVLGIAVGASVGTRTPRLVLVASLLATFGLVVYVLAMPEATQDASCGCGGIAAIAQSGPWDARVGHLVFLGCLAIAHLGCVGKDGPKPGRVAVEPNGNSESSATVHGLPGSGSHPQPAGE